MAEQMTQQGQHNTPQLSGKQPIPAEQRPKQVIPAD
jgi:hypothetical protein